MGDPMVEVNGVGYYQNGAWHAFDSGVPGDPDLLVVANVVTSCRLNNSTFIGGDFWKISDIPNTSFVAEWRDDQWHSLGVDTSAQGLGGGVDQFRVLNGELNVLGSMDWVFSDTIDGWAIWDGLQWRAGDNTGLLTGGLAKDLIEYQGDRYIAGNFNRPGFPHDIARWTTDHWESLGPGIQGDPWVNELAVYGDKLYVCGEFAAGWGNPASGLMTWDGTQWANPFPQIAFVAMGRNVQVANGKLWFCGPFMAQGLPGIYNFGVYDGTTLCVFGGNGLADAGRMCVAPDTLYAFVWGNDLDVNALGQWPLNGPVDTCYTVVQSVASPQAEQPAQVFPNPAQELALVRMPASAAGRVRAVQVLDAAGKEVLTLSVPAGEDPRVDVRTLSEGAYLLRLFGAGSLPLGSARLVVMR